MLRQHQPAQAPLRRSLLQRFGSCCATVITAVVQHCLVWPAVMLCYTPNQAKTQNPKPVCCAGSWPAGGSAICRYFEGLRVRHLPEPAAQPSGADLCPPLLLGLPGDPLRNHPPGAWSRGFSDRCVPQAFRIYSQTLWAARLACFVDVQLVCCGCQVVHCAATLQRCGVGGPAALRDLMFTALLMAVARRHKDLCSPHCCPTKSSVACARLALLRSRYAA